MIPTRRTNQGGGCLQLPRSQDQELASAKQALLHLQAMRLLPLQLHRLLLRVFHRRAVSQAARVRLTLLNQPKSLGIAAAQLAAGLPEEEQRGE
jgi:hypothetical protein